MLLGLLAGGDAKADCQYFSASNESTCTSNNSVTTPKNNSNGDWVYCQNPPSGGPPQVPDGGPCLWIGGMGSSCYPNCISPGTSKSRSMLRQ